jgi:hypothetical protein
MDTRICKRCGIEKRLKSFKKHKNFPDRLPTCRKCYDTNQLDEIKRTQDQIESQRQKMIGKKYPLEHRIIMSNAQKRVVEEGRHNFKNRKTPHKEQDRHRLEYKIWKEKLLEIYEKKCGKCKSEKRLHGHHIKCFYEFPELRYDIDNGILLCQSCHSKLHRKEKGFKHLEEFYFKKGRKAPEAAFKKGHIPWNKVLHTP